MEISVKSFEELNNSELYELLALRAEVFVVEQNCPYQDPDGKDPDSLHVLGWLNGVLAAYARIYSSKGSTRMVNIGRIVVKPTFRNMGLGKEIVKASEAAIKDHFKDHPIKLSAQSYLQRFYNELGYKTIGEPYLEDGIPHIAMIKE